MKCKDNGEGADRILSASFFVKKKKSVDKNSFIVYDTPVTKLNKFVIIVTEM